MENEESNIVDMTVDGSCGRCGQCCGLFIPFTKKELKVIVKYVEEHNIEPTNRMTDKGFDARCCFYNLEEHKCNIYEVRPFVCKHFICNDKDWKKHRDGYERRTNINSSLSKNKILATFDDTVYGNIEPLMLYITNIVKEPNGSIDSKKLVMFLKSVGRLDLLSYIKVTTDDGKEVEGTKLLEELK